MDCASSGSGCRRRTSKPTCTHALEGLLAKIYDVPGVTATRSYVVLSTYLERPVQPGITGEWPGRVKDPRLPAGAAAG